MLIIDPSANEQMAQTLNFAVNAGCVEALTRRLDYLARYGNVYSLEKEATSEVCTTLFPDRADYSFGFKVERKTDEGEWRTLLVGGLIYHGPASESDPLSVEVDPEAGHHWGVHS